ncbi:thermonuclease family protein [Aquibium sp. LZ166]|uniref:Thermonuclease family protein n=1 Tax=Aquibium pacificus TaxID=3153579 RepID=A0ABV3ST66_9HYPH
MAGERFGSTNEKSTASASGKPQPRPRQAPPKRPAYRPGTSLTFGFLVLAVILAAAALPFLAGAAQTPDVVGYFASDGPRQTLRGDVVLRSARGGDARQPLNGHPVRQQFSICGASKRVNCVVDGDTFWLDGVKIRIADIDTPEVTGPACATEKQLAGKATLRLQLLLNSGEFELRRSDRDEDRYGRKLRTVHRDGRSIGEILVADGLAHEWRGHKESWCG